MYVNDYLNNIYFYLNVLRMRFRYKTKQILPYICSNHLALQFKKFHYNWPTQYFYRLHFALYKTNHILLLLLNNSLSYGRLGTKYFKIHTGNSTFTLYSAPKQMILKFPDRVQIRTLVPNYRHQIHEQHMNKLIPSALWNCKIKVSKKCRIYIYI